MLLFLDLGLGIQLGRDYGSMYIILHSMSMILFAEMYARAFKTTKHIKG